MHKCMSNAHRANPVRCDDGDAVRRNSERDRLTSVRLKGCRVSAPHRDLRKWADSCLSRTTCEVHSLPVDNNLEHRAPTVTRDIALAITTDVSAWCTARDEVCSYRRHDEVRQQPSNLQLTSRDRHARLPPAGSETSAGAGRFPGSRRRSHPAPLPPLTRNGLVPSATELAYIANTRAYTLPLGVGEGGVGRLCVGSPSSACGTFGPG